MDDGMYLKSVNEQKLRTINKLNVEARRRDMEINWVPAGTMENMENLEERQMKKAKPK